MSKRVASSPEHIVNDEPQTEVLTGQMLLIPRDVVKGTMVARLYGRAAERADRHRPDLNPPNVRLSDLPRDLPEQPLPELERELTEPERMSAAWAIHAVEHGEDNLPPYAK
jgi:hypothetical protein